MRFRRNGVHHNGHAVFRQQGVRHAEIEPVGPRGHPARRMSEWVTGGRDPVFGENDLLASHRLYPRGGGGVLVAFTRVDERGEDPARRQGLEIGSHLCRTGVAHDHHRKGRQTDESTDDEGETGGNREQPAVLDLPRIDRHRHLRDRAAAGAAAAASLLQAGQRRGRGPRFGADDGILGLRFAIQAQGDDTANDVCRGR